MLLFILNIVVLLLTTLLIFFCLKVLMNSKKNEKRMEDFDRKIEVLIRVTAHHEMFIDNVKKKSEEFSARNRKAR